MCTVFPAHLVLSWFPLASKREPGKFWTCYLKYEEDVSIQEIRGRRPAALLSLPDARNRHSCRRRRLINRRIKMKEQKEDGAWKTTGMRSQGCPTDPHPFPPSSHIQIVWLIFYRVDLAIPVSRVKKKRRGQHNPHASVIQGRLIQCPMTQRMILRQLGEY